MYGIGLNIKIKGGVYGSNVILNATKGDTRNTKGFVCGRAGYGREGIHTN
jgi:hypothetical protein